MKKHLFLFFWFCFSLAKGQTVVLDHEDQFVNLYDHFEWTERSPGEKEPRERVIEFQHSDSIRWERKKHWEFGLWGNQEIWFKGQVHNKLDQSIYLDAAQGAVDTLEYFLIDSLGILHFYVCGNLMPYHTRPLEAGYNAVKIPPGNWSVFIRARAKFFASVPLAIMSEKAFHNINDCRNLILGLFYGVFTFLAIYLIYINFKMKDPINAYFVIWVLSMGFVSASANGTMFKYVWPELWEINQYRCITLIFLFSSLVFAYQFLHSSYNPQKNLTRILYLTALSIPGILIDGLGFHHWGLIYTMSCYVIGNLYVAYIAYKSFKNGFQPARLLLIGSLLFVIGFAGYSLPYHIYPGNFIFAFEPWILPATTGILIHCFALPDRYAFINGIKEKEYLHMLEDSRSKEQTYSEQYKTLEKKVQERTLELRKINQDLLSQKEDLLRVNETKDKFFSIISHDLRGPVANLYQLATLMETTDYRTPEMVDMLKSSASYTLNLLDNILTWARSQSGEIKTSPVRTDLKGLLLDMAHYFSKTADSKNIHIVTDIGTQEDAFCDVNMVQTILRNLISNAIKFTPNGGEIQLRIQRVNSSFLSVSVIDSGIGMSETQIQALFQVRKHISTPGTEGEMGTGLGLLLCKEFVEKNKGELNVFSTPGKGSEFTFTLRTFQPAVNQKIA